MALRKSLAVLPCNLGCVCPAVFGHKRECEANIIVGGPRMGFGRGCIVTRDGKGQLALIKSWGRAPEENVWVLAPFGEKEEDTPLKFEEEYALLQKRKRAARRALNAVARTFPKCEWVQAPTSELRFRAPPRDVVEKLDEGRARAAAFRAKLERAEQQRPPFITIWGAKCFPVRGNWRWYARRQGEDYAHWQQRVRDFCHKRAMGRQLRAHQQNLAKEPWQQIELIARKKWRVPLLYENKYVVPFSAYSGDDILLDDKTVKPVLSDFTFKRTKQSLKSGPKTCWGFEYREKRLRLKLQRFLLQQEWREARCLRREKMSRVLVKLDNHQVISLRAGLTKVLTSRAAFEHYRQQQFEEDIRNHDVFGEMEEPQSAQGTAAEPVTEQSSNVVVQKQVGESVGSSLPQGGARSKRPFSNLSLAPSRIEDSTLHDRFYTIKQFDWITTQSRGTKVLELEIPKDILNNKAFQDSPNYAMFSRHMYWNGDVEIEIIANTNVRQFGQLQFSFYYADKQDAYYNDLRENIYTASQRLHSLLTANVCNTVRIQIPFEYIFPILQVGRVSSPGYKSLGKLLGLVVIPITANATCPQGASVSVGVRFKQSEFAGMVPRSINQGEMLPALASVIAVKSLLDKNRDNPSVISPGMPVIPINTSSWCVGTGQSEYTNVLRLNPNKVLPYPEGRIPDVDEMTVDHVRQVFGMVDIKKWVGSDQRGQAIWSWNATPLDDMSNYPEIVYGGSSTRVIPPVGVLSSLFAFWRGSLDLRIDLVAATEISGAILIAYVPMVDKAYPLTMEKAFSCSHSIHHITENRQIHFKIPFVASHPFWPRRATLSTEYPTYSAPGAVFVFCYNQLKVNCTIPDECNLVFYLRGGEDFEVAVPACPSLGTGFDPKIFIPTTVNRRVVSVEGYTPYYSSSWRSAFFQYSQNDVSLALKELFTSLNYKIIFSGKGDNIYFPVLRYGSVSDHVAQFRAINFQWGVNDKQHILYAEPVDAPRGAKVKFGIKSGTLPDIAIDMNVVGVVFWLSNGYVYGTPIPNITGLSDKVKKVVAASWATAASVTPESVIAGIISLCAEDTWKKEATDLVTVSVGYTGWWSPPEIVYNIVTPVAVQGEGADEKSQVLAPVAAPQKTAASSMSSEILGETFTDLKDLCRRYQLYASDSIEIKNLFSASHWRTIVIRFPVMPQGLDINKGIQSAINEYWNRTRDGPIPLIASGYRFFTGGIRFRICINVLPKSDLQSDLKGKIFVQHRPNVISSGQRVIIQSGSTLGTDDLELPGYAAYHQFEDLNNVLSVEIPFYMPSIRTYLQRPSNTELAKRWSNLGELAIGLTVFDRKQVKINYDIYYSLADDARFSVFVGFPPVIDIAQIPQDDPPKIESSLSTFEVINLEEDYSAYVNTILEQVKRCNTPHQVEGQNLLRQIFDIAKIPSEKLNKKTIEKLQDLWYDYQIYYTYREADGPLDSLKSAVGLGKVDDVVDKADKMLDNFDDKFISELKESSSNLREITEKAKNWLPSVSDITDTFRKYVDLVINGITNFVHCLLNFNYKSILTGIVSFLVQLKVVAITATSNLIEKLQNLFSFLFTRSSNEHKSEGVVADGPESEDDLAITGYVSSLIAAVCAVFSYVPKFCKARKDEIGSLLLDGIRKFTATANNLFTFIKNNLVAAKRIAEWFFNDHPSIKKLSFLQGEHENVYIWAKDVLEFTDPRNENLIFTSPARASKAFALASQGAILHIKLLDLNLSGSQVNLITTLINKINQLRDRLTKAHMAPPVRFEPFVIELTSRTGLGKSELLRTLPYEIFRFMNFKHEGELIYNRQIGNAYWNNLRNQPVCVIDEKFPIKAPEFSGIQLAELFQLKSSCIFNPPMADIPDKNIRYNPLIVMYASNAPFPNLDGILCPDAVSRRRDMLFEVDMREDLKTLRGQNCKYIDLQPVDKAGGEYSWLRFRSKHDVVDTNCSNDAWSSWMDYTTFKDRCCHAFRAFFVVEEKKFRKHLAQLNSLLPDEGEKTVIQDLFNASWFESIEKSQTPSSDANEIRKLRDNYQKSYSFSREIRDKTLLAKISIAEFFNNQAEVERLLLEFRTLHPTANHGLDLKDSTVDVLAAEKAAALQLAQAKRIQDQNCEEGPTIVIPESFRKTIEKGYKLVDMRSANFSDNSLPNFIEPTKGLLVYPEAQADGPEPNAKEQRGDACIHTNLATAIQNNSTDWRFDRKFEAWELKFETTSDDLMFTMPCSSGDLDPLARFKFVFGDLYKKSWELSEDQSRVLIKHVGCPNYPQCPFSSKLSRKEWVTENITSQPVIRAKLYNGKDMSEILPLEFLNDINPKLESIEEHKKMATELKESRSWFSSLKESFYKIEWKKWLKRLTIVIAIFGLIGAAIGMWSWSTGNTESAESVVPKALVGVMAAESSFKMQLDETREKLTQSKIDSEGQMSSSGDLKAARSKVQSIKIIDKTVQANIGLGLINQDSVQQKLRRNTFFLSQADSKMKGCRCLGLCGQFALIVGHYRECWEKVVKASGNENMFFVQGIDGHTSMVNIPFSSLKFFKIENSSLEVMKLPKMIRPFRDIRSLFCKKNNHNQLNLTGTIANYEVNGAAVDLTLWKVNYHPYSDLKVKGGEFWADFKVANAYEYTGFHGAGQCGSVLLADRCQQPIIGIHVAGARECDWGYSELVYQEMFASLDNQPSSGEVTGEGSTSQHYVNAHVLGIGKVSPRYAHHEQGKSRIVPSLVQSDKKFSDKFIKYAEPAILDRHDPRNIEKFSPMKEGCKHHGHPLLPFNPKHVELAKEDVLHMVLAYCKPQRSKVGRLTVDEAVGGLPDKDGYEHMEFSTSEGFPFVGMRPVGYHNKRWLFEFDEENKYVKTEELLQKHLDYKWQQRLNNEIPATIFTDCLKDCVVPLEKVAVPGKTRIFSISPVDFTIQQRQCTLDFSVAYMACRRKLEHMVGCNPNSLEWTWLARDLLKQSNNIMTGDYSKYGDSLPCEFIHAAFEIIRSWYQYHGCQDAEMFQQLKIMPYEIGNSLHLMFDHIYACCCGQPSGNSLTVIINSIANSLYMRVAWLSIMADTKFSSLRDFSDHVTMFSYGDDLIVALSDAVKDVFNGVSLHAFFGKHGLKFTNANKSDIMIPYDTLQNAEFLKAGFKPHPTRKSPQIMLAPLPRASIENTVLWVWSDSFGKTEPGSPTFESMSLQVCYDSVRNAFGRGPEYYTAWVNKLQKFWLTHEVKFSCDTWQQMDRKIFDLGEDINPWSIKTFKNVFTSF